MNIGSVSIADYLVAEVWCDRMTVVMRRWHELCWNIEGSQVCLFVISSLSVSLLCVCLHCTVSSAYTSVHNLATHMCHLPYNCHLHSQWAPLAPYKSCVSHPCVVRACIDRDSTIWYFIFTLFTLVAEPRSSASVLDRSTQQGELRSSAMSGGTDRREDEQVPQFYGRINEKFAEWETDVRLWQVEFKVEDRGRLGPRLYRRALHGQPKIIVKTKLGTQDVAQFTVDNIIKCLKDNGFGELPEELGQEALDNYFDMRQGKAESIQDYIFHEEILTVALQKDTAIDLDEKIRRYWLMRNFWNRDHHSRADRARASQKSHHPDDCCKET